MVRISFSAALLSATAVLAANLDPLPENTTWTDFCVQYFGNIKAQVEISDDVPKKNYNDSIECPRKWDFPKIYGAIFQVCPPNPDIDDRTAEKSALETFLFLGGGSSKGDPAIQVRLQDIYMRNESSNIALTHGVLPTNITAAGSDEWVIEGTQQTLNFHGESPSDAPSVAKLDCSLIDKDELDDSDKTLLKQYCGTSNRNEENGDCWGQGTFALNILTKMNYTIEFANLEASVNFTVSGGGNDTDGGSSNTTAHFTFVGSTELPDNDKFWDNAYKNKSAAVGEFYDANMGRFFESSGERDNTYGPPVIAAIPQSNRYAVGNMTYFVLGEDGKVQTVGDDDGTDDDEDAGSVLSASFGIWTCLLMGGLLVEGMDTLLAW